MIKTFTSFVAFVALAFLTACSDSPEPATGFLEKLNASYEEALDRSNGSAYMFPLGSVEEQAALANLESFFSQMSPESVRSLSAEVYSEDAYLNDNIVGVFGLAKITDYFSHAAEQAEVLDVVFIDVARSEADYFVRWRMTVQVPALNDGAPLVSYGVTQFRLNKEGKVVLHRDFWDAATGLHEHLPYIGGMVSYVHAKIEADALKH